MAIAITIAGIAFDGCNIINKQKRHRFGPCSLFILFHVHILISLFNFPHKHYSDGVNTVSILSQISRIQEERAQHKNQK